LDGERFYVAFARRISGTAFGLCCFTRDGWHLRSPHWIVKAGAGALY
jgi:hypothetical protein